MLAGRRIVPEPFGTPVRYSPLFCAPTFAFAVDGRRYSASLPFAFSLCRHHAFALRGRTCYSLFVWMCAGLSADVGQCQTCGSLDVSMHFRVHAVLTGKACAAPLTHVGLVFPPPPLLYPHSHLLQKRWAGSLTACCHLPATRYVCSPSYLVVYARCGMDFFAVVQARHPAGTR